MGMGNGTYLRRHELRLYLAVTSISPLRAYAYNESWVNLAAWKFNSSIAKPSKCMLDTRAFGKCPGDGLTSQERTPSFHEFIAQYQLTKDQQDRFDQSARDLIGTIIAMANQDISAHPVNKGINASRAACFSFMR